MIETNNRSYIDFNLATRRDYDFIKDILCLLGATNIIYKWDWLICGATFKTETESNTANRIMEYFRLEIDCFYEC